MDVFFFIVVAIVAIAVLEEIGLLVVVVALMFVLIDDKKDENESPDHTPTHKVVAPNETLESDPKCESSEVLIITNESGERECILGGTTY